MYPTVCRVLFVGHTKVYGVCKMKSSRQNPHSPCAYNHHTATTLFAMCQWCNTRQTSPVSLWANGRRRPLAFVVCSGCNTRQTLPNTLYPCRHVVNFAVCWLWLTAKCFTVWSRFGTRCHRTWLLSALRRGLPTANTFVMCRSHTTNCRIPVVTKSASMPAFFTVVPYLRRVN